MPEQESRRGDSVTTARFTGPFETQLLRFTAGSLNLKDPIDALNGWARLTNVVQNEDGDLTGRPGQTAVATAGTTIHSVRLLRDPQAGSQTRIWGVDTHLYRGASGALISIDAGYSGHPLTLVPHRPTLSGDPWMYVADSQRLRKVRADGLVLPIGLPAPGAAASAAFFSHLTTNIAKFDAEDGTEAAAWTGAAGSDSTGTATDVPLTAVATSITGSECVAFTTAPGSAADGYDSWWGVAMARNLTTLQAGGAVATDDDLMHFWLQIDQPHKIEEIRLYLICSNDFSPTTLPGTDEDGLANTIGYVKAIRQYDFAAYLQGDDAQINVAEDALLKTLRDEELAARRSTTTASTVRQDAQAQRDQSRTLSFQGSGAAREWVRFGYFEIPLRRGDFQRFGTSATGSDAGWGTVTGCVIYVRTVDPEPVTFRMDGWFLHGGFGIDSTPPGNQPYDWRYTHYDPRTGAESNPSPTMTAIDVDRKNIVVTCAAYGDGAVRQRFYRRGGTLIADWYYVGQNSSDGGALVDEASDTAIAAAGTVALDHYQPVPTVDDTGATVLAQPLRSLWGPVEGMLMGCGDPYRPGHVYYSNADQPEHWSASGNVEVCPPSEELLSGGIFGGQSFVWSRQRLYLLYPNLSGAVAVTATPTPCTRGPIGPWAWCVGPGGIFFLAEDGVFVTSGGVEEWLSKPIDPLFKGLTANDYPPIDLAATATFRSLTVWENKLHVLYQAVDGARYVWVYDLLLQINRIYQFGRAPAVLQGEQEADLLIGGYLTGTAYTHTGTSDAGLAIAATVRSGAIGTNSREEKLFGDQVLDAAPRGVTITVQNYLNEETVANGTQTVDGVTRARYILDAFGTSPQKARSISAALSWSTTLAPPVLYQIGVAVTPQPDITNRRPTNWDDLNHPDESWVSGVTLDCDTGGEDKHVVVERDYNGTITTITTLTVNCDGRHKRAFSWPAVPAAQVRLRPEDDDCRFWMLYRADWIAQPEPPKIAAWDIYFENGWDQYYTGLDLFCDTYGAEKQIEVSVDGTVLTHPTTGLAYWSVQTSGKRVVHLTLPWGRGHVLRFRALDANPGQLYDHRWHTIAEPSEQANWNQPFTILGTQADKYLKAVIFEVDTFGVAKSVGVEIDGTTVETLTVQTNGRRVVQLALTQQRLGRVFRFMPVPGDGAPSRLYSLRPIFDEEPFQLTRWETQETNHNLPGYFTPLSAQVVLKATAPVELTIVQQYAQETNRTVRKVYPLAATDGQKLRRFVTFYPIKGVMVKYLLTSSQPFHLYREESLVVVQPWGAREPVSVRPFGSDDLDPTRPMVNATLAAGTSGGTLGD